jgi:hypothetical protein
MKNNKLSQHQNQKPTRAFKASPVADLEQIGVEFAPAADEVARRAYFSYLNQGSLPGHDVQHWLLAEAELLVERNFTRLHGFHNRT